jgi:hypothetical protein
MTRHFIPFPLVGRYPPDDITPRFETVSTTYTDRESKPPARGIREEA